MSQRERPSLEELEAALAEQGTIRKAAAALGIPKTTFVRWHKEAKHGQSAQASKRKLTEAVLQEGELTEEDLKNPEKLIKDHGLDPADWDLLKVDLAARDAAGGKVNKSIAVSIAPQKLFPRAALKGQATNFKARPKRKAKKEEVKLIVVLGDEQAPNGLDEDLHEVVCQFLRDTQPDELVHIGDLGDFESVSSYQQLNPGQWSNTVQECLDSSYRILGNYMANLPEGTKARYLIGNHEVRLQRYLLNQAKELYGVHRAGTEERSVLDLAYLLRLDELGIELVESDLGTYPHPAVELVPNKLIALHGDVARKKSGTSPHATAEGTSYGVIHGHTHRAAVVSRTIRSTSKSYQLQSAEIGCLCKTNGLGYTSSRTTDWQQGFATVAVWPDGHYHIDLASYQNGALVWRGQRWS